jgi:anaerobic selenocysteine-containing dehydrogenase
MPDAQLPMGPHSYSRALNASVWAAQILSGELEPPIRMAYIVASNLINAAQYPWQRPGPGSVGLRVVHEPFPDAHGRSPTWCCHHHRPGARDLVDTWATTAASLRAAATDPAGEARSDYQVFSALAARLGFAADYTQERDEAAWLEEFLAAAPAAERADLERDGLLRIYPDAPRIELADFRRDPATYPLPTPSGRIEIENPAAEGYGLPAIASYLPEPEEGDAYPLHLLTPHSKLRSNSCVHSNPWVQRLEEHTVWLNPADAAARGLVEGDLAEVVSPRGAIRLPVYVTARIMPGVACVYQGTWYRGGGDGHDGAADEPDPGGCANVLTDHVTTRTGGPATHSAGCRCTRRRHDRPRLYH